MILDDEEDILKLYNDYLSSKGHKILRAHVNADNQVPKALYANAFLTCGDCDIDFISIWKIMAKSNFMD